MIKFEQLPEYGSTTSGPMCAITASLVSTAGRPQASSMAATRASRGKPKELPASSRACRPATAP
jgi:hypothetical protein